jgi:hypothetical protein
VKNCSQCKHRGVVEGGRGLVCRRYPPTTQIVVAPAEGGGVAVTQQTFWPRVNPNDTCGEQAVDLAIT